MVPKDLKQLIFFRSIIDDPLLNAAGILFQRDTIEAAATVYHYMINQLMTEAIELGHGMPLWRGHLLNLIAQDENPFSLSAEGNADIPDSMLLNNMAKDIEILESWLDVNWKHFLSPMELDESMLYHRLDAWHETDYAANAALESLDCIFQPDKLAYAKASSLWAHYAQYSCGELAMYHAFEWNNGLIGIPQPDPIHFFDLVGCDYQKHVLRSNTEAFLAGRPANHVLLCGARGTGKSSSIKALLNEYAPYGLRMVELKRDDLNEYPQLVETLRRRRMSFIVFIDDLSFENFEVEYKSLKSAIEGSLRAPANNVLLCACSNVRQLVAQPSISDSRDPHDSDRRQEKLSFVSRFGITLNYYTPSPEDYLKMVKHMAQNEDIELSDEELCARALQWELNHHGRSGRSARQFIDSLLSARLN
ncbi:MAG: ATP-binding protein [Syntrophomonadaceae bacterium]|nr:ATP-binding protein [Syntrophomonadaceae bacterium]